MGSLNNRPSPIILGIESSCDDTSASVIAGDQVLSNIIAGQSVHQEYGGVVPELASRAHLQNIVPTVHQALLKANITTSELDAIAFTRGPGLLGALAVGVSFAKSLALGLGIPMIEIDHMEAHILAHFIDDPKPTFPFICLTASGGHTQLTLVHGHRKMELIGSTKDDAVGEAFDKTAKLLGLPYPGGPMIDRLAKDGNPNAYTFPKGDLKSLDFSFSGIKTAILYFLQKQLKENPNFIEQHIHDICASVQSTFIDILLAKVSQAAKHYQVNQIAISGGVSANSMLRSRLQILGEAQKWQVFIPKIEYCTDNAAMIAIAAHYKYLDGRFVSQKIAPYARIDR